MNSAKLVTIILIPNPSKTQKPHIWILYEHRWRNSQQNASKLKEDGDEKGKKGSTIIPLFPWFLFQIMHMVFLKRKFDLNFLVFRCILFYIHSHQLFTQRSSNSFSNEYWGLILCTRHVSISNKCKTVGPCS